jgi:hypothetical protein
MAWVTIREVTNEDLEKLERRAQSFCVRHNFDVMQSLNPIECVDENLYVIEQENPELAKYLNRLWTRVVQRATGEKSAAGISYRSIGYHVD